MIPGAVLPRYGEGSIAEVVGSVCDGLAVPGAWDVLQLGAAQRVVVVVIDGLGHHQLADHADLAPTLVAHQCGVLTSVTPATTPVALTSIGTGLPPGRHGLVGASFLLPETGRLLWPLGWGDHPSAEAVQPEPTWWQRAARAGVEVAVVSPRAYAAGGLTAAALRGGAYVGADGPGERVAQIAAAARRGERALVYGYWEYLDRAAHMHGVDSDEYRAELVAADWFVARLAECLPAGARLVVTSDHGVLDCPDVIDLTPLTGGDVHLVGGEPRLRHVYCRPGTAAGVARRLRAELAGGAVLVTRDEAVSAGLFGPVAPDVAERIGDLLIVPIGTIRLVLPEVDPGVSGLIGQHGALSPAEMEVPLVVVTA